MMAGSYDDALVWACLGKFLRGGNLIPERRKLNS